MPNFRQVTRALSALPIVASLACLPEGTTDPLADAATMVAQTSPNAAALVSASAAPTPSVFVSTKSGKPVPGAPVSFSVTAGNGAVTSATVTTDKQGVASVGWTYGALPGQNTLTATLGTLAPVVFTVSTTAGGPADMTKLNDGQSGPVGEALPQPVAVVVHNLSGQPVAGAAVTFTAKSGSTLTGPGTTGVIVSTDTLGRAQTPWTMATVPGMDTLTAEVNGVPAATFVATAVAGAPFEILTTGDAQTGTVDLTLPTALGITVRDKHHNTISGLAVTYAPQNGGAATPATDMTSATGQSSTQWKLPVTSGKATLTASAGGLSVVFSATATPSAPTQLIKVASSDAQVGDAGQPLPQALALTVRDAHDNPVPNVLVTFNPASGSVNPGSVSSDATGLASTSWTLGTIAGATTLTASAAGVATTVTFTATARAPDPCASHGVLVIGTAVSGDLSKSTCDFPPRRTHVDLWTLNLSGSTPLEVIETIDNTTSPDAYMAMYRGQYAPDNLVGANDDIDADHGNYNSHVRFLGGAGSFLVGASYAQWFVNDPGGPYHLVAQPWNGAVTACEEVFAVNGTRTSQVLDNNDCVANTKRAHSDQVMIMLKPGETLVVNMASSMFDAKLDLENSAGTTIASDDNSGGGTDARLTYTVPATAAMDTYVIYATSVFSNAGGNYTFSVDVTSPAASSPMMSSSSGTTGTAVGAGVQRLLDEGRVKPARQP